jgi:EAL domain-containing protein (putative c-di-GMP-specific phosphodiesterase class I)
MRNQLYLKRFPVDFLKIDQSFVSDLANDTDGVAIAQAIVSLGHALGACRGFAC